jgi:hypothetical protein
VRRFYNQDLLMGASGFDEEEEPEETEAHIMIAGV